jgi:hypothetical protein
MLTLVVLATDPPVTPPVLAWLFVVLAVLPAVAVALLRRVAAAEVEVGRAQVIVRRRHVHVEVPCEAIARIVPWDLPLPGPGLSLRMRSGRRLRYGLEVADHLPLLTALGEIAGLDAARAVARHPAVVWAHARAASGRWRWYHLAVKFILFPLGPAAVLFNAHQHIAYGGLLGEYYLYGLAPYLATFGVHWGTVAIYCVLYAGVWRIAAEALTLLDARVAPSRVAGVRRGVELACRAGYYLGVPALLGVRFLG